MYLHTDYTSYDTIKYSSNTPDVLSFNINRRKPRSFLIASLNLNPQNTTKSPFKIPSFQTLSLKPSTRTELSPEKDLETLPAIQTIETKSRYSSVKPARKMKRLAPIYHNEEAFLRLTSRPRDEYMKTLDDSSSPSRRVSHLLNPDLNASGSNRNNLKEAWSKQLNNLYNAIKCEKKILEIQKEEKKPQIVNLKSPSRARKLVQGYGHAILKERELKPLSTSWIAGDSMLNKSAEFLGYELKGKTIRI